MVAHRGVGDLQVSRVMELTQPFPALEFFPDTTAQDWASHRHWLAEEGGYDLDAESILLPMQSFVIRSPHHTVLVDTCIGNHKDRPHRPAWHRKSDTVFMDNLAALGLRCEDIDFVMCTHLHVDHVGWNTRLVDGRWVPTFPNAKYLMSAKELEVFKVEDSPTFSASLVDSVLPVVEAGCAQLIDADFALDDHIWLESTPGHTPDHFAVRLASRGQHAVLGGDLMHSPVQCLHPEWRPRPDWQPELARETRTAFMQRHCENDTLVCMAHFPLPSAGRFIRERDAFRFEYDAVAW